jgi:hypothetical protein
MSGKIYDSSGGKTMANEYPAYLSYLLRLWRVEDRGEAPGVDEAVWRASLESAHTGEKKTFASMDDLFEFLRGQTGQPPSHPIGRKNGERE